jgi:hypothetical protein
MRFVPIKSEQQQSVPAIETAFKEIGNRLFSVDEEERVRAYKAARKIAAGVRLRTPVYAASETHAQ